MNTLQRKINRMPSDIKQLLEEAQLMDAYRRRPPYQRNDYLGWIAKAKRPETKEKRTSQMIAELKQGNVYMKMAWHPL